MKKLLALILALMLIPVLPAFAEEESIAGTWYFVQLTYADYTTTSTNSGLDMMLVLEEDGDAFSTTVSGLSTKETSGEWYQEGNAVSITLDGEERTGYLVDGQIVLGSLVHGQKVLYFSRTAPLGVYYTAAEPFAATLADYVGEWQCRYALLGTRVMSLSALDSAAQITVTPFMANVYIRNTADNEVSANTEVALRDSVLLLGPADAPLYTLQLLEDGIAACEMDSGVVYYFERVIETEE